MCRSGLVFSTGGGDAPGLNAVIRAVVMTARNHYNWDVVGIARGFDGLYDGSPTVDLQEQDVRELLARGGTILAQPIAAIPLHIPFNVLMEKKSTKMFPI